MMEVAGLDRLIAISSRASSNVPISYMFALLITADEGDIGDQLRELCG